MLPIGILIAFILMRQIGVDANIMSLGGIAIAIGVMVDSGCVLVENMYRKIAERRNERGLPQLPAEERLEVCIKSAQEVGRPVLFALLTTIVGFIPVFVLTGQAGKLFRPLAFTKTFAMIGAALIALTLMPTLAYFLLKGRLKLAEDNATSRFLFRIYKPAITWALERKKTVVLIAIAVLVIGSICAVSMKQEFMPPLNEGDLLFMPVLLPGASLTQVQEVLKTQDMIIKDQFPNEVEWVVGKLGRAETATDPAPIIMLETIIHLKPQKMWRRGMTREKLIVEIQEKAKMPGVSPIMTQPIRNRIDMLATGIQTPVGVKVFGSDLKKIEEIAIELEKIIKNVNGAVSPFAMMGEQVPLSQVARLKKVTGPSMIQSENTLPYARIFINVNQDVIGLVDFVKSAQRAVNAAIKNGEINLPPGYYISWSGQFESEMESRRKLIPSLAVCLVVILLLLYVAFNNSFTSLAVVSTGLPVSLMGGIILLFILGFKFSTAVWVGFIALFGVATDNAVVLVSCLDDLFKNKMPKTADEIRATVIEGGLLRVRPCMMTTTTTIIALIPVMLATGTGSEIMKPMASPTVGGLVTATLSNLILVPVLYCWLKERRLKESK